ncbi:MAG: ABC transporter ATP-binding protein, partial [Muribaculaceae bacterium]|nr:ABC transporter ATP-binding protein [Muribaculaceae bacterium]
MNEAILLKDVTKRYGSLTALDKVSFSVHPGEMFGLIGPDGSGKSTIYRILATLSVPDEGEAEVCGLNTVRDYRQLRTRIGYMPEKFSLYPDLSVMENLRFFAALFGVSVRENFDLIAP